MLTFRRSNKAFKSKNQEKVIWNQVDAKLSRSNPIELHCEVMVILHNLLSKVSQILVFIAVINQILVIEAKDKEKNGWCIEERED